MRESVVVAISWGWSFAIGWSIIADIIFTSFTLVDLLPLFAVPPTVTITHVVLLKYFHGRHFVELQ